jgi:hypothetical protein
MTNDAHRTLCDSGPIHFRKIRAGRETRTPAGGRARPKVCEVVVTTDDSRMGHYCGLPAVVEKDGLLVCEAHADG